MELSKEGIPEEEDLVLETLLAVAHEVAPELDREIVIDAYRIQKKYQFDDDKSRSAAIQEMQKLIEGRVAQAIGGGDL